MIHSLLLLALLTVTDPVSGPAGATTLTAPTSAMYRNLAPFDIQEVAVLDEEKLELQLKMGSWSNPLGLENGFSHPIIELYVGGGESGSAELLPGSGMILPDGETWTLAIQLTGDRARGWYAGAEGVQEFEPTLQFVDDYLYILTEFERIETPRLAAISGLYSPFHQTGWRPVESSENAWAFSGSDQQFPVVDVLALSQDAQLAALSGGVLPVTEVNLIENPNTVWFALMAAGVAVAGVGLVLRGFGGSQAPVTVSGATDEQTDGEADVAGEGEPETDAASARLAAVLTADSEEQARREAAALEDQQEPAEPDFEDEDDSAVESKVAHFRGADDYGHDVDDLALPEFGGVDFSEIEAAEQEAAPVPEESDAAGSEVQPADSALPADGELPEPESETASDPVDGSDADDD